MILHELTVTPEELARRTGWVAKPEGLCKGSMCVPLPPGAASDDGRLDARVVAERLGMPVVHDAEHGLWALGPAGLGGRALDTAEAPELTLPDLEGNEFSLSSLRGSKVVVTSWASW